MFLPMPFSIPSQDGPASAYAMGKKPLLMAILVCQTIILAVRLVVKLDIMGGFIDGIVIGLGWYAWKQDMNIQWICYYAMMGLVQAVFAIFHIIDKLVHGGFALVPVQSSDLKTFGSTVWVDFIQLSGPIGAMLMLGGAYLGWTLYKEFTSFSAGNNEGGSSEYSPLRANLPNSFTAFQGNGQKLGSV